jgi:hypothetical protein
MQKPYCHADSHPASQRIHTLLRTQTLLAVFSRSAELASDAVPRGDHEPPPLL